MRAKPLTLIITLRAWKDLGKVPVADRSRILVRIEGYAADPDHPRHDVVRLVGVNV